MYFYFGKNAFSALRSLRMLKNLCGNKWGYAFFGCVASATHFLLGRKNLRSKEREMIMHVIALIIVLACGVLGQIIFDSAFWGAIIGLLLCFAGLIAIIAMPSKKEFKKSKTRKSEDNTELQNQWDDKKWLKANETEAYSNRRALNYFGDIIDNPGTPKKRRHLIILMWVCCILAAAFGILFGATLGADYGGIEISIVFFSFAAILAGVAIYLRKSFSKKYVLWLKAVNYNFLEECRKAKIRSLNSRENIARMMIICEKIGMKGTEEELVIRYRNAVRESSDRQSVLVKRSDQDRIDSILEKDEEAVEELNALVSYTGRDKMVRMCEIEAQKCRDKLEGYESELSSVKRKYESVQRGMSQQEHSWATHGGIASGIAGPVAGAVTAARVEAKNEQIREYNRNVGSAVASVAVNEMTPILHKISEAEKEVEKWEQRAIEAKNKLVEELPEIELLNMLAPTIVETKYNDAGTLRIGVEIIGAKPVIYDKVQASVDGYFRAVFMSDDERVGEAILCLPYNGSARKQKLTGICIDAPEKDDIESIVFEPIKLWAIER